MSDLTLAAVIGAIATAALGLGAWSINTVRRADLVVKADKTLRQTIDDQATCIATLEEKVRLLTDKFEQALTTINRQNDKIAVLERIIGDMEAKAQAVARRRHDGVSIPEKSTRLPG